MAIRKALREFLKELKRHGLTVIEVTPTSNHIHLRFADFPQKFVIASSPSDKAAYRNALYDAKRLARNHQQQQEKPHES